MSTVRARSLTQRTGAKAVVWGVVAAAVEALLGVLTGWQAPEVLRPWIPIVVAALRFLVAHLRTSSVDAVELAAHAPNVTVISSKGNPI